MLENLDSQALIWGSIAVFVLLAIAVTSQKMRRLMGFLVRGAAGAAAMLVINFALGGFGFAVGINIMTVAIAAFLGIPGIIMLYGLGFFM